jgi:hypothetical protein
MANLLLLNPNTGTSVFGRLEEMRAPGVILPAGRIYLKAGEHYGPNHGYGGAHIWAEHAKEMASVGFMQEKDVPAFVATIVCPGAQVFYEANRMRGNQRVSVVRSANGTAILQFVGTLGVPRYFVITAFKNAKAHGTKVGIVRS